MRVLIVNSVCAGASTGKIASGLYDKLTENGHESLGFTVTSRVAAE